MPAPPPIRPSKDKDAASLLVELLKPGAWIPLAHARWLPVIEALLEAFLRHFDGAVLGRLLDDQRALPPSATAGARAARMAGELTALHKICQMLARNPRLPAEARAALTPLESLPPEAIPDAAVLAAVAPAVQARPDLELDPENPKVARGSVADVFRFRDRTSKHHAFAFKTVRADSLLRIQNEAAIIMRMAEDCPAVGVVAGPNFAAALAEALRDAAGALLREIDFVGEAANLRDARAFYKFNRRIRVPATIGIPVDRESLWSSSRAFRFSTLRSTTNPGAMLPGLFFDACSSIRCSPDFPNPFFTPIRMPGISWCKRGKRLPAHARASGLEPGGPALRAAAPRAHRTLSLLRYRR